MLHSPWPSRRPERFHWGDSALVWLAIFAGMGLLGLWVILPRFSVRQAQLETNFEARTRVWESQQAASAESTTATPQLVDPAPARFYWLAVLLGGVLTGSLLGIWRQLSRSNTEAQPKR